MSLFKEAMVDVGVSVEEFQAIPVTELMVEETIVNPADSPSASIPVEAPIVEPIVQEEVVVGTVQDIPVTNAEVVIEQTVCEHQALQEKAEQMLALQTTMENYHAIVRGTGFKGIDSVAAKLLQVQLKEASRILGVTTKIGSMEAFSAKDMREQHDLAVVSLEDIRATGKAAAAKFMEIVQKIIEFIKRSGQQLWDGIIQVERAVEQLDGQLSKIKAPGGEGTYLQNQPVLKSGEGFDSVVSPDIHGLAHFASYAYPEAVVKFLDGVTKGVIKFDPQGAGVEEVDSFFEQYSKPLQFLIEQQANKDQLPGGYTLDVSPNGLSIGVTHQDSGQPALGQGVEVPVMTTVALRKHVRDIKALITQLKDIRPETEKISQSGKKLVEATQRSMAKGKAGDEAAYEELATKVGKMVQESSPRAAEIIEYIVRYIKAHCVSIGTQIKVIETGATEA